MAAENEAQGILHRLRVNWEQMSNGKRIAAGTLVLFTILASVYLFNMSTSEEYATVLAGLDPKDASTISQKLDEKSIPYELAAGGTAITVPTTRQHEVRLMLAGEGLPTGGTVGFELFDEPKFGMTDFEQRMNYRRALQGELRRTIVSLKEVNDAHIHLVLPKKGTFREDDQAATASVVLTLAGGTALPRRRTQGIVNLVAAAVEGLTPDNVTVIDQNGKQLSAPSDPMLASTMPALDYKRSVERGVEDRVLQLVEPVVGLGKARVNTTANIDFAKVEQVDELYDPEKTAVRSQHKREEADAEGGQAAAGVPGVRGNQPGAAAGQNGAAGGGGASVKEETTNYEVNTTRRTTHQPVGEIKSLHVALLVDGTYQPNADGQPEYAPRSEEELRKLEALVKTAIGFDADRGDKVTVSNMAFVPPDGADAAGAATGFALSPDLWRLIRYGLILALAALILMFVVRPLLKVVTAPNEKLTVTAGEERALPPGAEGASASVVGSENKTESLNPAESRMLAHEFATNEPRKTAQILRTWLLEDGEKPSGLPSATGASAAM